MVLERMDGASEGSIDGTAETWNADRTDDFNTVAIDCIAGPNARNLTRTPGLPDDAFEHDGQLTKQEVRAITLSALAPTPGAVLWDLGAGSGSIAIEWMRQHPRNFAIAIEHNADRLSLIAANASALGTPRMQIVSGKVPDALAGLEPADAVFIGGGITTGGLVEHCWNDLKPGGRLVANVVTTEGERILSNWRENYGGDLRRISIERAEPVGRLTGWHPAMTVTQYIGRKS